MRSKGAAYIGISGAHLPCHIAGRDQTPARISGHRAGNIQRFIDQDGLRVAEILFVRIQVKYLLDARRGWFRLAFTRAQGQR